MSENEVEKFNTDDKKRGFWFDVAGATLCFVVLSFMIYPLWYAIQHYYFPEYSNHSWNYLGQFIVTFIASRLIWEKIKSAT